MGTTRSSPIGSSATWFSIQPRRLSYDSCMNKALSRVLEMRPSTTQEVDRHVVGASEGSFKGFGLSESDSQHLFVRGWFELYSRS